MKNRSAKIANASVIAAGMVVGIHTAGRGIESFEAGTAFWWWLAMGMYGVFQIAVPYFFLCSGYFIAGHMKEDGWYGRECKKRVMTLLIPYIFWSILFFALEILVGCAADVMHGRSIVVNIGMRSWVRTFGLSPFECPRLWPLWFVRSLVLFVILSPVLKRIANGVCLILLFVLAGWLDFRNGGGGGTDFHLSKGFCLFGLFFYIFGMSLRLKTIRLPQRGRLFALVLGWSIIIVSACLRRWFGVTYFPRTLCAMLLIFGSWRFVPASALPGWLTNSSFAVFVMHPFFLYLWVRICPLSVDTISIWMLKWIVVFGGCVIVAATLRLYYPKITWLTLGGR